MKNYKFIDKSVFLENEKILVIGDLHLGYEERLLEKGISIPPTGFKETMNDLEKIFSVINTEKAINNIKGKLQINNGGEFSFNNKKIKEIIILGDLKHDFAGMEYREADNVLRVLEFLKGKCEKIVVIKGNHDNYVISTLKKKGIELVKYYERGDILFMHGDKKVKIREGIKRIFLGHMHPAISIKKNVKEERYKCFLVGKWKNKEIIILPSFFPLFEGADIFEDKGEFLAYDFKLNEFDVYIVVGKDLEVLHFGKVKDVGKLV